MTRDEAIEATARALCALDWGDGWEDCPGYAQEMYRSQAAAVLDAIGWVEPVEGPSKLGGNEGAS